MEGKFQEITEKTDLARISIDQLIASALESGIGPLAIYIFIASHWTYETEIAGFTRARGSQTKEDVSIHTPSGEYVDKLLFQSLELTTSQSPAVVGKIEKNLHEHYQDTQIAIKLWKENGKGAAGSSTTASDGKAYVYKAGISYCPLSKLQGYQLNNNTNRKAINTSVCGNFIV